jgi:hypothetical protein
MTGEVTLWSELVWHAKNECQQCADAIRNGELDDCCPIGSIVVERLREIEIDEEEKKNNG